MKAAKCTRKIHGVRLKQGRVALIWSFYILLLPWGGTTSRTKRRGANTCMPPGAPETHAGFMQMQVQQTADTWGRTRTQDTAEEKGKEKKKSKTRTLCPPRRCQGQPWVERVKQLIGSMWQTGQEDELSGCVRSCRPTRISTVLIVYSFPLFFSRMLLFPDARAALDPVSIRNTMVEWAAAHGINWGPICTYYKTALRSIRPTKKKKGEKRFSKKKKNKKGKVRMQKI